jgi:hypothetical protein
MFMYISNGLNREDTLSITNELSNSMKQSPS